MSYFKYFLFGLLFFSFIYFITPNRKQALCNAFGLYLHHSFDGVVIKKFINYKEHSFPFIYVRNSVDKHITKLDLFDDKNNVYNSLKINDSIVKLINDPWIYKRVNNKLKKWKAIDFGCKNLRR
jgi:hypothetical protein